MASLKEALILFFPFFLAFSSTVNSQNEDAGIAVYWGGNVNEGTLMKTCQSGSYKYVILSSLNVFGCGRTPSWNFDGHCSGWGCLELAPEIEFCQSQNIKVFLSIGGPNGDYSLCSPEDAKEVANFLWQLILSGQEVPDVPGLALDGIVFDIEGDRDNLYYDVLVTELNAFRAQKQFYLTAAPKCHYPDIHLHAAIDTGYFDFISIKFYNNPSCEFDGSTGQLFNSWDIWMRYVPSNAIVLMGITANPGDSGYIPPDILPFVLEHTEQAPNYGGITLWNRYWDIQTIPSYSDQISPYVSKYVLRSVTKKHKAT